MQPHQHRNALFAHRHSRGLSLIELMVSLTLGLFLIAGMLTLLARNSNSRAELDKAGRQVENGRYAAQRLSEDLHNAGFYGEFYAVPAPTTTPSDPCAGGSTAYAALKTAMVWPVAAYTAASASPATCIAAADFVANTDVLVVRFASPLVTLQNWAATASAAASSVSSLTAGVTYMQANIDDVAFAASTSDATANFGTLKVSSGAATNLVNAPVYRYITRIYFLSPCSRPTGTNCDATADGGSPIPTLKMVELTATGGAAAWSSPIPVAEGIERLSYDFGLDSNTDGSPDSYTRCSPCAATDWPNIVAVRINMVARNTEASPDYTDAKTYSLGTAGPYTPSGTAQRYKRHEYQLQVRLNNVSMRREQ